MLGMSDTDRVWKALGMSSAFTNLRSLRLDEVVLDDAHDIFGLLQANPLLEELVLNDTGYLGILDGLQTQSEVDAFKEASGRLKVACLHAFKAHTCRAYLTAPYRYSS